MYRYAQLGNNRVVIGVSQLSGEVKDDSLILIEDDFNPWGKKFDKTENSWIDIPAEETKPQAPTMDDNIEE